MNKSYRIVWPGHSLVTEDKMRGWAEDAIANEEIHGPASLPTDDLAKQLHEAGLITLLTNPNEEEDEEQDPRRMIEEARDHHPDCQCNICTMGGDAWLFNYYPGEY